MQQKRLTHTLTDKRGGEIKEGEGGKRPTVTIVHVVVRSWLLLFCLQNKISFLVQHAERLCFAWHAARRMSTNSKALLSLATWRRLCSGCSASKVRPFVRLSVYLSVLSSLTKKYRPSTFELLQLKWLEKIITSKVSSSHFILNGFRLIRNIVMSIVKLWIR